MTTSQKGIDLIKEFEGLRLTAYQDSVGIWTIGFGHCGDVAEGMQITPEQAEETLKQDVHSAELTLDRSVKVILTQNQYDSLISFIFNVGAGQKGVKDGFVSLKDGSSSTMLRLLNSGDYRACADQFPHWCHAGGQVLPGLLRRRMAERALFLG